VILGGHSLRALAPIMVPRHAVWISVMAEPFSFQAISAAITSFWARSAILLWCLATACSVALIALAAEAHWKVGDAPALLAQYGAWLGAAIPVLLVLAVFKTYSDRPKPTLVVLPREGQSFCALARQRDGTIATQLSLRFQATNLTDGAIVLSAIKLRCPFVRRHAAVSKQMLPLLIEPHSLTNDGLADIGIAHRVGRVGKTMRVVVFVRDHAGRWHKLIFPHLPIRGPPT
jgi:hypothetical protein